MFVLANFINALAYILNSLFFFMQILIFIRAFISWFNPDPYNPLVQFLIRVTEPVLEPIRRFLPHMSFDISPIIALLVFQFLQRFLVPSLYEFASRLQ
jgi:YggT family protein